MATPENRVFAPQQQPSIFTPAPKPPVSQPVAFNRAYIESIVNNDPWSITAREEEQRKQNIVSEAARVAGELVETDRIKDTGELANFSELSPEEKRERVTFMLNKQDMNKATPRNIALLIALESGADISVEAFDRAYQSLNAGDVQRMVDQYRNQQRKRLRDEYERLMESTEPEGAFETVGGFAAGELVPFYSVLARLGLSQELLETIKPNAKMGLRGWFTGEVRQEIRSTLAEMTPQERVQAVSDMVKAVEDMESDPVLGELLIDYNINETFEQLLTEDLVARTSDKNTFDRWVGNLEIAIGGAISAWLIGKLGFKSTWKAVNASTKVPAKQAADTVANRDYIKSFQDALVNSDVGTKFNISKEAAVVEQLPKPAPFVDNIQVLTPAARGVLERSRQIQDEILGSTSRLTGYNLNSTDKVNAVRKKIEDLNLGDQMEVMPGMSTIRMMEDDVGFEMTAVIGKNAEEGWDNLQDLGKQLAEIDGDLENFTVVRRNADGVLEPVFENPNELRRLVDEGTLPESEDPFIYAGLRISELGDDDIIRLSREDGEIREALEREAIRRADTAPLHDEYFLRHKHQRFWHTADKQVLEPEAFTNTGFVPRVVLSPNGKFGDEIYGTFNRLWLGEQVLSAKLENMFDPFYKLPLKEKKRVVAMFEQAEAYGKATGEAPTLSWYYSKFDDITPKEIEGLIALREGHDTMFQLLNRKLYREYMKEGYVTARTNHEGLPAFHGKRLSRQEARNQYAYDPVEQDLVKLSDEDIEAIYGEGGTILKNDLPVDIPNKVDAQADNIIIRNGDYEIGELSKTPMRYHPGYSMRFYEDPYFIVREVIGASLNGKAVKGNLLKTAQRTAPTRLSAENYLRRKKNVKYDPETGTFVRVNEPNVRYRIVRARDIEQSESTFLQKQTIQQEGRLFWDERNFDRLPDVHGNPADLDDPVRSLERAVGLLSRQVTMEDAMKGIRTAFRNEFGDLPGIEDVDLATQQMKTAVEKLKIARRNNVDKALDKRYMNAIELGNYIRLLEGVNDPIVPLVREQLIKVAYAVDRLGGRKIATSLEKMAESIDPFRTLRSIAFNLFMVFRPARQALLQSAQIGFISPLDPDYVFSGGIFKDAFAIRRGLVAMRKAGYDDGFSTRAMAKTMGLKEKEYRKLVKQFDRSGIVDSVDVHSFAGGSRRYNKIRLPDSELGNVAYGVKRSATRMRDFMQDIGFNFGERNNVTFSYLMAVRRAKKKHKVNSLLEFSDTQWDEITTDASNLALGMVRPNDFGYQHGILSLATQFLSFTHKAGLALLAQNPAIKGKQALAILVGTWALYGANMFGARDFVQEQLRIAGIPEAANAVIGPEGETLLDILANGIIENALNAFGSLTFGEEEYQDIDFSFLAPGVDIGRLRELTLDAIIKSPVQTFFGPAGSIGGRFFEAHRFATAYRDGFAEIDNPAEKLRIQAVMYTRGLVPMVNDAVASYYAYQAGRWANAAGESLPVRANLNTILARTALGARSQEEMAYYNVRQKLWESEENVRSIIEGNRELFSRIWRLRGEGAIETEHAIMAVQAMMGMIEDWPEAQRARIIDESMNGLFPESNESLLKLLATDPRYQTPNVMAAVEQYLDQHKGQYTPEQEQQIRQMVKEVYTSRVANEEVLTERLQRLGTE